MNTLLMGTDCVLLEKRDDIEKIDNLHRHSQLGEEASMILDIIEGQTYCNLTELPDKASRVEELEGICLDICEKSKELDELLAKIKRVLTEKQYKKIKEQCQEMSKISDDIYYLAG